MYLKATLQPWVVFGPVGKRNKKKGGGVGGGEGNLKHTQGAFFFFFFIVTEMFLHLRVGARRVGSRPVSLLRGLTPPPALHFPPFTRSTISPS